MLFWYSFAVFNWLAMLFVTEPGGRLELTVWFVLSLALVLIDA